MREVFYDFFGLNKAIFLFINQFSQIPFMREALFWFEKTTTYNAFTYHLALIVTLYLLYFLKKKDKIHAKRAIVCLVIYLGSMVFDITVITFLKHFFSLARPYCSLSNLYVVQSLVDYADCFKSFPSGHTAYITVLVCSFMPAMNRPLKISAAALIFMVMMSRIMIGAHYPADLLWSFLISFAVVILVRKIAHILHYVYKNTPQGEK